MGLPGAQALRGLRIQHCRQPGRSGGRLEGTATPREPLGPRPLCRAGALRDPAAMPPLPGDHRTVMAMCPFLPLTRDTAGSGHGQSAQQWGTQLKPSCFFPENK